MDHQSLTDFEEGEIIEEKYLPPPQKPLPGPQEKRQRWLLILIVAVVIILGYLLVRGPSNSSETVSTNKESISKKSPEATKQAPGRQ